MKKPLYLAGNIVQSTIGKKSCSVGIFELSNTNPGLAPNRVMEAYKLLTRIRGMLIADSNQRLPQEVPVLSSIASIVEGTVLDPGKEFGDAL